jgi:hypothetical protein
MIKAKIAASKMVRAKEIETNSSLKSTLIKGNITRRYIPYMFMDCEKDTEMLVIDKVISVKDLEGLIYSVQTAIPVEKRRGPVFSIKLKEVVIVCAESITHEDIINLGSSMNRRIELIEITE